MGGWLGGTPSTQRPTAPGCSAGSPRSTRANLPGLAPDDRGSPHESKRWLESRDTGTRLRAIYLMAASQADKCKGRHCHETSQSEEVSRPMPTAFTRGWPTTDASAIRCAHPVGTQRHPGQKGKPDSLHDDVGLAPRRLCAKDVERAVRRDLWKSRSQQSCPSHQRASPTRVTTACTGNAVYTAHPTAAQGETVQKTRPPGDDTHTSRYPSGALTGLPSPRASRLTAHYGRDDRTVSSLAFQIRARCRGSESAAARGACSPPLKLAASPVPAALRPQSRSPGASSARWTEHVTVWQSKQSRPSLNDPFTRSVPNDHLTATIAATDRTRCLREGPA